MKFLLSCLANLVFSLATGIFSGFAFINGIAAACGDFYGQDSPGGGAAIGIFAIFVMGGVIIVSFGWFLIADVRYDAKLTKIQSKIAYKSYGAGVILLGPLILGLSLSFYCLP
jgi:hypothetical protein